jgi:sugar phosphate permease
MSSWYTRAELAHRFAWFYSGAQLANAFGGLIAAGILANLDGSLGLAAWRWVFIIEGSITIAVASIAMLILPNYPATTQFLLDEEKAYAQWRLIHDTGDADTKTMSAWTGLKLALKDSRVYLFVFLQHCSNLSQTFM